MEDYQEELKSITDPYHILDEIIKKYDRTHPVEGTPLDLTIQRARELVAKNNKRKRDRW